MHSATGFARSVIALLVVFYLYIPLNVYANNTSDGVKVITSNERELVISYKPVVSSVRNIKTSDGINVLLPVINGAKEDFSEPGAPLRLVVDINITVPSPDGFVVENITTGSPVVKPGIMAPVPTLIKEGETNDEAYTINDVLYSSASVPAWAEVKYAGIARNRHIAHLQITAARYNNLASAIEIPSEITVKVRFNPSSLKTNNAISAKDDYLLPFSINQNETRNWIVADADQKKSYRRSAGDNSVLSTGNWLKVKIDEEGIYRIDAAALSSAGASIPKEAISTIKMFTNGGADLSEKVPEALNNQLNEQPIMVETNGSGDLSSIVFYGSPAKGFTYNGRDFSHYINHYSNSNYYLLTWGGSDGKRAEAIAEPDSQEVNAPDTYLERTFFEEELRNAFAGSYGSGRTWFGNSIFPTTYSQVLYNLVRRDDVGNVTFKVAVAHNSSSDGRFTFKESSNSLPDITLPGFTDTYTDAVRRVQSESLPPSKISSDNPCILNISYSNPKNPNAASYLDWIELTYPRNFYAINNEIGFFSDLAKPGITKYTVNGFSGNIYGFDVTDPAHPLMLGNTSVTGSMFIFKTQIDQNKPKRFFISSNIKTASQVEQVQVAGLRDRQDNADMIVITHRDLLESANAYRDYRSKHDGMNVIVVTTDDIFTEFGSCIPDPTAIRDYLAWAYSTWSVKPKYVLLWGDGHYDFKDITHSGKPNYVPPFESLDDDMDTYNETRSYTSDDYFANIAGDDDRVDVALGRLTVDSPRNGLVMLDKIKKYENSSSNDMWRTIITLMADDGPTSNGETDGYTHGKQSEDLSKDYIPEDFQQKKIYLVEYPTENVAGGRRKPAATQDLVTSVNTTGTLLLNWVGHGSPRVWAHEEVFERDKTTALMNNPEKLFFVSAATCDFGRFDMTDVRCGSEELVMNNHGGAIGSFAATRVVYSSENASINKSLFTALLQRDKTTNLYPRLGEAMFKLKQSNYGDNDKRYYLLGDPALKLAMPDNVVAIDSINGVNVSGNQDTVYLKAMSTVKITGRILKPASQDRDETFNGTAVLNMFDSDKNNTIVDADGTEHFIINNGGALNRSSYKVESGSFTASFVIPKDISFSGQKGRLYAYAYSNDNRYAKGSNRSFILNGIDSVLSIDDLGPNIKIYLDSREFQSCETVSRNPLLIVDLKDATGINTTGMGIGHRIEAWIDDNPNSVDLTEKFSTSLDDSKGGSAQEMLFGLQPGNHTVRVRAWDVYNNYSVAETCFNIASDKDGAVVDNIYNYPNPFSDKTTIRFLHNMPGPFSADIRIYNVTGQLVRTLSSQITTLHTGEVDWDGYDDSGRLLPQGIYIYRLTISGSNGSQGNETGTLSFVR